MVDHLCVKKERRKDISLLRTQVTFIGEGEGVKERRRASCKMDERKEAERGRKRTI